MFSVRLIAASAAAALVAITMTPTAALAAGPDPNTVYIASITYGGTGCPQGTVGQSISNDRRSATLIFDSFVASTGPGVPVTEGRKNCQLNLNLHVPRSVVWGANVSISHRGYVQLPAGTDASRKDTVYSPEIILGKPQTTSFSGPIAKDYLATDSYVTSSLDTLLCKGEKVIPNNINAQVRIDGPTSASAQITTDSIDFLVEPQLAVPCGH